MDGPRISIGAHARLRPRWGRGRGAVAEDLNRLNRELGKCVDEIRAAGGGGRRVRAMFQDVYAEPIA